MKLCQTKGSLNSSCHKNNKHVPANIHIERFKGCASDWSILNNDWLIQRFDLLALTWGSLCYSQILNIAFPDFYKKVKLMAKV